MPISKKIFTLEAGLFILCTVVYIIGLSVIDVMDVDSSQYASISLEMFQNGNYLEVMHRGSNYLDKPPLLFWLSALFYKLFGVSHFVFRLPSFIFTILGTYSTFKLGELLYNSKTGLIAALIIYSSQAYFLFNHDVRTDCLLTNSVVFSVWQLWKYIRENKIINFFGGFLGIALAMLAKGPIGLIIPVFAVGSDLLLKKDFKRIFQLKWLGGLAVVFLLLSPMLYGLYKQYGADGPRFFLWTQSFGRITGESVWENDSTVFFFTHIFMWSFLPWSVLFIPALVNKIKNLVRDRFIGADEVLTLGGFTLTFIALSLSRYKLPHYIFVTYPFAAIITAAYLVENTDLHETKNIFFRKFMVPFQWVVNTILLLAPLIIMFWIFPKVPIVVRLGYFLLFSLTLIYVFYRKSEEKIIYTSALCIAIVNLVLNSHFYPMLLKYQSSSVAANYLVQAGIDKNKVFWYKTEGIHAFDFYLKSQPLYIGSTEELQEQLYKKSEVWLYTNEQEARALHDNKFKISFVKKIPHQSVTLLTTQFINPATRKNAIRYFYLLKIKEKWR